MPGEREITQAKSSGGLSMFMKNSLRNLAIAFLCCASLVPAPAATLYWSGNGTTLGGAGTWNTSGLNWGSSSGGPFGSAWVNANVDTAILDGTAGTITVGAAVTVNKITNNVAGFTFAGSSKITFSGTGAGLDHSSTTTKLTLQSIGGTTFTKTGAGRVELANNNDTVSRYIVLGGVLTTANTNKWGSATGATNFLVLDNGAGWGIDTTSQNLSADRGIYLNSGGGSLGSFSASITMTVNSRITGPGSLSFPAPIYSSAATWVLSNKTNDWAGLTQVKGGTLTLGASEVLPNLTYLQFTTGGSMDLNGFDETVGKVLVNSSTATIDGSTNTLVATNFDMRASSTISAKLGGSGNLVKTTTGTVDLTVANTYTGGTAHNAGTLRVNNNTALGPANSTVTLANGVTLSTTGGTGRTLTYTYSINGDIILGQTSGGTGALTLAGSVNLAAGTRSIQIDNATDTISGVITNGGLAKAGTGTLNLTGNNTYADGTTVNAGLLNISGTNFCVGPTLVNAGRLSTTPASSGGGSYGIADGAVLGIRQIAGGASLPVSDLTLGFTTTEFDFARLGFPATNLIYDTGALNVNGTVLVDLKGFDNINSATLVEYAGARTGPGNFTIGVLPPRVTGFIDESLSGKVIFNATNSDSLVWVGDLIGTWDVNNSLNQIWKLAVAGTPTEYQENTMQGDTVRFDDTLAGTTTVSLPGTVSPFNVTVDNSVTNYSFTGAGKISGGGSLTKSGTGEITLATANDFTGGTILNGGTANIGNNAAFGTGRLIINSVNPVVLRSDSATDRSVSVAADLNGDVTYGDPVTGGLLFSGAWTIKNASRQITVDTINATNSGIISQDVAGRALTKAGTGILNLTAANTFSGGFSHNSGMVRVNNNASLGAASSPVSLANGVTLSAIGSVARTLTYIYTINGDFTIGQATGGTGALTLAGAVDLTGTTRTLAISNTTDTISAAITNGGLIKIGPGTLVLSGTNTYGGGTTVGEGMLQGTTAGLQGNITNNSAVTFNQTTTGTFSGLINGSGTLTKSGTGSVTLAGNNTYSGATTISAGTLTVNGSLDSTGVTVNSSGTLGGTGPIAGPVIVNSGGSVGAGSSAGGLILTNGLDLSAGGTNVWELAANSTNNAGTDFDQISLAGGNLALGGTSRLLIKFIGTSTTPTNTDAFWQSSRSWKIISGSGTATNAGPSNFAGISGTNGITAGTFSTTVDNAGNVFLNYASASLPPPPQSQINPNVAGQVLSWSTTSGYRYYVEYKDDLNAGWSTLTNIVAAGTTTAIHDESSPLPPQRFYRVVSKPPYN